MSIRKPFDAPTEPVAYARWNYGDCIPPDDLDEIIEGSLKSWTEREISLDLIIEMRVHAYIARGVKRLAEKMTREIHGNS